MLLDLGSFLQIRFQFTRISQVYDRYLQGWAALQCALLGMCYELFPQAPALELAFCYSLGIKLVVSLCVCESVDVTLLGSQVDRAYSPDVQPLGVFVIDPQTVSRNKVSLEIPPGVILIHW